jgi:DNA-binding NarL/FixJ family response regulator
MSGIAGIRLLKERYPGVPVLMLTVYDDDQRIFDARCAGACGYLLKKTPPDRLLASIAEALDGTVFYGGRVRFQGVPVANSSRYSAAPHSLSSATVRSWLSPPNSSAYPKGVHSTISPGRS